MTCSMVQHFELEQGDNDPCEGLHMHETRVCWTLSLLTAWLLFYCLGYTAWAGSELHS
jgi:hypothetical protein